MSYFDAWKQEPRLDQNTSFNLDFVQLSSAASDNEMETESTSLPFEVEDDLLQIMLDGTTTGCCHIEGLLAGSLSGGKRKLVAADLMKDSAAPMELQK